MAVIEVDFDVYKALTVMRPDELTTYNDVLRRLLEIDGSSQNSSALMQASHGNGGCNFRGVFLPNGTQLHATYKGKTYLAGISDGFWIGQDGKRRNSPSDAACAITKTNVNGWRFWKAKRPGDGEARLLEEFRSRD